MARIKIFLAEDEFYALAALKQKIIDLDSNYEVVGTAAGGMEALEALEEAAASNAGGCPDILMTDIRMPDMDGITLISRIRDMGLPILPVIISGYQEFAYAKQAVRLGVQDYLLKPVDLSELADCLKRCAQRLTERLSESLSKKNIFSFLIGDEPFRLESLSDCDSFTVIYLIFANALSNLESIAHPTAPFFPCERVKEAFTQGLPPSGEIYCFNGIFSNEKVIILENAPERRPTLEKDLAGTAENLSAFSGTFVTLFYTAVSGTGFSRGIQHARKGAVSCMILNRTQVCCRLPESPAPAENLGGYVELLSMLLQQNQADLLRSNVQRMFRRWERQGRTLQTCQADLVFILNSLKRKFSTKKPFDFDSLFFVENVVCFSPEEDKLAGSFSQLLLELFSFQPQKTELSAEQLVARMDEYFRDNLTGSISLQDLADELGVSKVYLCRIFKKYKNTTPIDYFTHMKIERAQELIRQLPDLSLREISESLGFSDVYYFSKVFKRVAGLPPSELRKQ